MRLVFSWKISFSVCGLNHPFSDQANPGCLRRCHGHVGLSAHRELQQLLQHPAELRSHGAAAAIHVKRAVLVSTITDNDN